MQWQRAQTQASSGLQALPFSVPLLPTNGEHDYVSMWTVRTYMITLMAKEGIPRLKVDPDMWTLSFCKMNPDENQHLKRMYLEPPAQECGGASGDVWLFWVEA